jgi:hypothetical protein
MSFDDFRKRVQATFDFPITLDRPYKLCDFRPAYGSILEDYLQNYDFWGYCDLDMIFGDIRKFCPEEILSKYDKIFTRGHLTLYRNTPEVCRYYRLSGGYNYRDVFSTHGSLNFDERPGINKILKQRGIQQYSSKGLIGDISALRRKFVLAEPIVNDKLFNYRRQVFFWEKGKTFRAYLASDGSIVNTEVAYIHLRKRTLPDIQFEVSDNLDSFFVTPDGFFPKECEVQKKDFKKFNKGDIWGKLPHYWERLKNRIKRLKS